MNEIDYDGWAEMLEAPGNARIASSLVEAVPRRARHRARATVRRPRSRVLLHGRPGWSLRLYGR